jgi:hypothetical protein
MSVSEREQASAYSSRAANDDYDSCEATESIEDASRDTMSVSECWIPIFCMDKFFLTLYNDVRVQRILTLTFLYFWGKGKGL